MGVGIGIIIGGIGFYILVRYIASYMLEDEDADETRWYMKH